MFMRAPSLERIVTKMKKIPRRDWGAVARSVFLALITTCFFAFGARVLFFGLPPEIAAFFSPRSHVAAVAETGSEFRYEFESPSILTETITPEESSSPYFWLVSGAKLIIADGIGTTIQGSLPTLDRWRLKYSLASHEDTEGGYAPQNLFLLLTRSEWDNVRVSADFRITGDNFTESPNRNASNGLFLVSRHLDNETSYYAGMRVDGYAVITKRFKGTYYTMVEKRVFEGEYIREKDINLLPHNEWISLQSETSTDHDGTVTISLSMKRKGESEWTELVRATDDGTSYASTTPLVGKFPVGIRTDFMDAEFDNFWVEEI